MLNRSTDIFFLQSADGPVDLIFETTKLSRSFWKVVF